MKNWMTWTCVALALCLFVGIAAAQEKGGKREGGKALPEGQARVMGKVKSVADDGKSIVVTVKKEEAENDMTFNVVEGTKVFVGREEKAIADVKANSNCMVVYTTADMNAVQIRVMGERGDKKGNK